MLWFLNRGTGFVLLGVLTATVVLGVLATRGTGRMSWFRPSSRARCIAT